MKNQKKIFTILLCGAGAVIATISFFIIYLVSISESNSYYPIASHQNNNASVYVLSGKIIDIQDKTVILETFVFDTVNGRWNEDKKETRRLPINDGTKIFKNSLKWVDEKKRFDEIVENVKFEDLKIGNTISANYSQNLAEIKDFSPESITILSV